MSIIRYRATKIKEHEMIPMLLFDYDQLELTLYRMKNGDMTVKEAVTWIVNETGREHQKVLNAIVETERLPLDPIFDRVTQ